MIYQHFFNFVVHIVSHNVSGKSLNGDASSQNLLAHLTRVFSRTKVMKVMSEMPSTSNCQVNNMNMKCCQVTIMKLLSWMPWSRHWLYSVTQLPVEFQWHWHVSNAEISIIRTTNIHILINLMIKMINLIGVIPYMSVMTDISAFGTCQCHLNSTGNWVTE